MEHRPDVVKPKDVEAFNPKDRGIALLIDEALRDYDEAMHPAVDAGSELALLPDPPEAA